MVMLLRNILIQLFVSCLHNQLWSIYPKSALLKPKILTVPYTFISNTFVPSMLSSRALAHVQLSHS